MTVAPHDIDPARFLEDHLAQASPDLLREMFGTLITSCCPRTRTRSAAPLTARSAMTGSIVATATGTATSILVPARLM